MTRDEIKLNVLRSRIAALEQYGYHEFLRRWWLRDGFGYAKKRVVFKEGKYADN